MALFWLVAAFLIVSWQNPSSAQFFNPPPAVNVIPSNIRILDNGNVSFQCVWSPIRFRREHATWNVTVVSAASSLASWQQRIDGPFYSNLTLSNVMFGDSRSVLLTVSCTARLGRIFYTNTSLLTVDRNECLDETYCSRQGLARATCFDFLDGAACVCSGHGCPTLSYGCGMLSTGCSSTSPRIPCISMGDTCACSPGFKQQNTTCLDVDECVVLGSYNCSAPGAPCANTTGPRVCPAGMDCVNTIGSFSCHCPAGFQFARNASDSGTFCEDVNECTSTAACDGPVSQCANLIGTYQCTCSNGNVLLGRGCGGMPTRSAATGVGVAFGVISFLVIAAILVYLHRKRHDSRPRGFPKALSRLRPSLYAFFLPSTYQDSEAARHGDSCPMMEGAGAEFRVEAVASRSDGASHSRSSRKPPHPQPDYAYSLVEVSRVLSGIETAPDLVASPPQSPKASNSQPTPKPRQSSATSSSVVHGNYQALDMSISLQTVYARTNLPSSASQCNTDKDRWKEYEPLAKVPDSVYERSQSSVFIGAGQSPTHHFAGSQTSVGDVATSRPKELRNSPMEDMTPSKAVTSITDPALAQSKETEYQPLQSTPPANFYMRTTRSSCQQVGGTHSIDGDRHNDLDDYQKPDAAVPSVYQSPT